ncbi:hypothetical protein IF125_11465 [Empedobacter stercoris]|uniref:hypothetical protein n=1 Tax=Empedobacter stercoris TaxID=1628248 RepID=UPI001CE0DBAA|nr:hypothetical protein [Empedobacter stercoris]MCA4782863.1 hypothetical protein [Empedobacter stercoris]
MEITPIFTEKLASFKYDDLYKSEYHKRMDNWNDFDYIYDKALNNNITVDSIDQFVDEIFIDREFIRGEIKRGCDDNCLFDLFTSIHNNPVNLIKYEESKAKFFIDSYNKYKNNIRLSKLRLYALRITNKCFIITGGAIKFSQAMQGHPDTQKELDNLKLCRDFLLEESFCDEDIIDNIFYN